MALPGHLTEHLELAVSDRDSLPLCPDCLHHLRHHTCDGCTVRDDAGNRCACIQDHP